MSKQLEVYKCELCGNIVEVLHAGPGSLVCCNAQMKLLSENSVEASLEKHVPGIEIGPDSIKVKVGSVPHPMEEKHYIEWIELIADGKSYTHFLKPGEVAEATFPVIAKKVTAREFCNLHGQWKADA